MFDLRFLLAAGAVALAPQFAYADETWVADFDEAAAMAREQGKDLLVDFTGSDWCVWCIRLHDEVFSHEEFMTYAQEHFVLVALDFPNGEEAQAKVPNPERNSELSETYGVQGFPTVLLMTPDGEVFGRTGYQEGGPVPYVESLGKMLSEGKANLAEAKALVAALDAAMGDEAFLAAWDAVIAKYEEMDAEAAGVELLADSVDAALAFDSDNATGRKLRATKALLAHGSTDEDVLAAGGELDPKNELGLLELVIDAKASAVRGPEDLADVVESVRGLAQLGFQDTKIAESLYANCAWWCWKYLEDPETAVDFARRCLALEPADAGLVGMLNDLLGELAPAEGEEG